MAAQVHQERSERRPAPEAEAEAEVRASGDSEKLKANLDAILDEIDEVLGENAEEMVRSYVQKGGQ